MSLLANYANNRHMEGVLKVTIMRSMIRQRSDDQVSWSAKQSAGQQRQYRVYTIDAGAQMHGLKSPILQ